MDSGTTLSWPFSSETVNRYIVWSQKTAKLSPQTVTAYLSDLATCHKLRDMDPSACSSFLARTMLKGAKNIASYKATPKKPKLIMTLSCLKIPGHKIASTEWLTIRKAACWAACTLAFFGSFRMSEILCPADDNYNADTLVWSDVIFRDTNSVTITIRHPKSNRPGGEKVDVLKFAGHNCCPVKALLALQKLWKAKQHDPVFAFSETEYLSKKHFNDVISSLLCKHIPDCRILGPLLPGMNTVGAFRRAGFGHPRGDPGLGSLGIGQLQSLHEALAPGQTTNIREVPYLLQQKF
jgi:hypothetical protein